MRGIVCNYHAVSEPSQKIFEMSNLLLGESWHGLPLIPRLLYPRETRRGENCKPFSVRYFGLVPGVHGRYCHAVPTFVLGSQPKSSRFVVCHAALVRSVALVLSGPSKPLKYPRNKVGHQQTLLREKRKRKTRSYRLHGALIEEEALSANVPSDNGDDDTEEDGVEQDSIQQESLQFLEWSSICAQVAQFASTALGIEVSRTEQIPFGRNQEESEELLDQTASACLLSSPLNFSGIVDVRDILTSVRAGAVCNVSELCTIQKMLLSTRRLYEQLENSLSLSATDASLTCENEPQRENLPREGIRSFSPLLTIMAGVNFCTSLELELRESLDVFSLSILDTASPTLAATRAARRENMRTLEALLLEIGEKVVAVGGMDSVIITTRRARLCVAVRASHRHLISDGVVLDLSNTGATLFMEPKAALELNNKEVQLASVEKAEENFILENLTWKLAQVAEYVWILLQKVTYLDLACARAHHAKWLRSVIPAFDKKNILPSSDNGQDRSCEAPEGFSVHIEGLSHPLLLGSALVVGKEQAPSNMPIPVDFKIRSGVSIVVVSGPNTGGKTASMKTLAVAALMAKAGLFIPAKGKPVLPWFDKVLADIGDSQSLEQSLSTFSGHIQRVCRILRAGGNGSLVLLDELGSGTDPSEGAALATAILQHMSQYVRLTIVTTHFAELSNLKHKNKRFEVASLEFDVKTLRPTYRVLWGTAGQSNALDIARSIGVDTNILIRAQHWMTKLAPEKQEERVSQLMVPLIEQIKNLQSQAEAAALILSDAKRLHDELVAEADDLEKRVAALCLQQEEDVKRDLNTIKSQMDDIVSNFEKSLRNHKEEGKPISMRDAHTAVASVVEHYLEKFGESQKAQTGFHEKPSVGDLVLIQKLGKKLATVIEVPTTCDDGLLVQFGNLKVRVKLSEVSKTVKQVKNSGADQQSKVRSAQAMSCEGGLELKFDGAIQTSRNTVDLRGMHVEEALVQLELAIRKRKPMSSLFVIHGEGTGALRKAVLQKLNEHPLVVKFEQESPMNFGCTVVYVK